MAVWTKIDTNKGTYYYTGATGKDAFAAWRRDNPGSISVTGAKEIDVSLVPQKYLAMAGQAPTPSFGQTPAAKPAGDINQFLDKYQQDIMASVTPKPETRGARTPEEISAMLTPSMALPEPLDYAKIFGGYREEYGLADLEKSLADIKAQEDELAAGFREQKTAERAKPVGYMSVIEGRIGEEERTYLERADYLGRQRGRIADELTTKYTLVNQLMGFQRQTYQDTVASYEAEYNRNLQMYTIVRGEERDALEDWERDVDMAKSNLTIFANAVTAGNLSWDTMDDTQKVFISKLEAQSGLPIGFISSLKMSAKDRLISVNEKTGEALMIGENGQFNVVQTGMTPTGTGAEKEPSEADLNREAYKEMTDWLSSQANDYGHVTGAAYTYARNKWLANGGDINEFDKQFRGYRDPYSTEQYQLFEE